MHGFFNLFLELVEDANNIGYSVRIELQGDVLNLAKIWAIALLHKNSFLAFVNLRFADDLRILF